MLDDASEHLDEFEGVDAILKVSQKAAVELDQVAAVVKEREFDKLFEDEGELMPQPFRFRSGREGVDDDKASLVSNAIRSTGGEARGGGRGEGKEEGHTFAGRGP